MNERQFAHKLTARLNRAPISPDVAVRLCKAREAAVERAVAKAEPVSMMRAGNALVHFWQGNRMASVGLLFAVLVAVTGSAWQWQQTRAAERSLEIDLLVDDVPVDFLLSDRTEQWIRR